MLVDNRARYRRPLNHDFRHHALRLDFARELELLEAWSLVHKLGRTGDQEVLTAICGKALSDDTEWCVAIHVNTIWGPVVRHSCLVAVPDALV